MNLIEKLDRHIFESSHFGDPLYDAWPKLRAVIESAKDYFTDEAIEGLNPKYFPKHHAVRAALAALEEPIA